MSMSSQILALVLAVAQATLHRGLQPSCRKMLSCCCAWTFPQAADWLQAGIPGGRM